MVYNAYWYNRTHEIYRFEEWQLAGHFASFADGQSRFSVQLRWCETSLAICDCSQKLYVCNSVYLDYLQNASLGSVFYVFICKLGSLAASCLYLNRRLHSAPIRHYAMQTPNCDCPKKNRNAALHNTHKHTHARKHRYTHFYCVIVIACDSHTHSGTKIRTSRDAAPFWRRKVV